MSRRHIACGVAAALTFALSACTASSPTSAGSGSSGPIKEGGTVTVALDAAWEGLNPHTASQGNTSGLQIGSLIYPSAFKVGPQNKVTLNSDLLASAAPSPDSPKTIVYKIKPTAVWSDGKPISADDFVYLWKHLNGSDEKLSVTNNSAYKQIESVTGSDGGKTVTVTMKNVQAEWQALFTRLLPAHHMKTLGDDPEAWNTGLTTKMPVSGGPFMIASNQSGAVMQLKRNPKWYGAKPHIDTLVLKAFDDSQALAQAVVNGEVDLADVQASATRINHLKSAPGLSYELKPSLTQEQLGLQNAHPFTGEPAVRAAIQQGINVKELIKALYGSTDESLLVGNRFLPEGAEGYRSNVPADVWKGDVAAARKTLQEAGYTLGGDGYFTKDGKQISLTWAVASDDATGASLAQLVQAQLKAIGIKTKIATTPGSVYFTKVLIPGAYDGLTFGYPGSAFPASWYGALYTCDGGYNFQRFCDKDVDAMFEKANSTMDPAKRAALLNEIDVKLWAERAPVPLFWIPEVHATADRLHGVQLPELAENMFWNVAQWHVG